MIAVVDGTGNRLYNSPAYQKVLGYSSEELKLTSSVEQIHVMVHLGDLRWTGLTLGANFNVEPFDARLLSLVQNLYLWTSGQLGETGGERPHKMKSPQTPFRTT